MIGIGVAAVAILVIIVSLITLGGSKPAPAAQPNTNPTQVVVPTPHQETDSGAPTTATPTPTAGPTSSAPHLPGVLQQGDTGPEVRWLQNRLKQLGIYDGDVTGTFDQATAAAVQQFQSRAHTSDPASTVGRSTRTALIAWGSKPRLSVFNADGEKKKSTANDIKRLQQALSAALNTQVKASGSYDAATMTAVMQYQAAIGQAPDGMTTDKVWSALQAGRLAA
jgi:peptidoglycan hydrolase-like protein with peptidoglycan-binding domain